MTQMDADWQSLVEGAAQSTPDIPQAFHLRNLRHLRFLS
jgi:hypothetical protein